MSTKLSLAKKKLDHPLAKYNGAGQLFCVLCNAQVKNEIFWTGHVNGKQHRDNLVQLKSSKNSNSGTNKNPINSTPPQQQQHVFKRPALPDSPVDDNAPPPSKAIKLDQEQQPSPVNNTPVSLAEQELDQLAKEEGDDDDEQEPDQPQQQQQSLPEGFFDDPKEDAKARGQKFKDPQEAEWDRFVKEIATEDLKSTEIVGQEEQVTAADKELDQIEEQMVAWQRVIQLEKRAEELGKLKNKNSDNPGSSSKAPESKMEVEEEEEQEQDDDDVEYDEEMDWRNKKR